MDNTTTVHARMDTTLKENVEVILAQLRTTSSDAIKLFYKQIELKVPNKILTEKKLMEELAFGEKSREKQGWLDLAASKDCIGL